VPPADAIRGFLDGLGVDPRRIPPDLDAQAGLYRSLLTGRRMLVVLDNARDAEQVRPLLPASPGCVVLVTSRDRLVGLVATHGAYRLRLGVLEPDEAVMLLGGILGAERIGAEPQASAELARVCGHLPLALRIAAANLLGQPRPSVAGYAAELGAGDRLAELAVDGDPQAAVGVAFGSSYEALDPAARRLFRLLGLVPGHDFTPAAAAALAGMPPAQAGQLLERLAGAHLLEQRAPGRYGLHDLLRLYARQRTQAEDGESERQSARGRLLGWYLQAADVAAGRLYPEKLRLGVPGGLAGGPERGQALAWLEAERANLVAVVEQAAALGPWRLGWLLADVLRGYFWQCLRTVEWLVVARAGLAAAQADGALAGQAAAHLSLGDVHRCLSRYDQAIGHYLRSLAASRAVGWVAGEAAALGNLGNVCWRAGRLQEAAEHHRLALVLDRQVGSLAGQAASLANLGQVCRELGRLGEAAGYYHQALALDVEIGYRGGWAMDLTSLGEVELARGHLGEAGRCLGAALVLHRELGDRDSEAETLRVLAGLGSASGDHGGALGLAQAAIGLARDTGNRRIEADALLALALAWEGLGELAQAAQVYQQALVLARQTSERHPEVQALVGLAVVEHRLGVDGARCQAERALALAGRAGYRLLEGNARTALAVIALDTGQLEQAITQARAALAIHHQSGHRPGQAHTLAMLGHALRRTQDTDAALACWQQALDLFTDIGSPDAGQVEGLLRTCAAERR
jgi:tetratricopeptide (TPR) repeat protein